MRKSGKKGIVRNANCAIAQFAQLAKLANYFAQRPPLGVKHSIVVDRETSNNYILRANGVAAGKFNISHISLWMPKVKPSLRVETEIDAMLVKGHIKQLYFEQMRVYRTMFQSTETSMT